MRTVNIRVNGKLVSRPVEDRLSLADPERKPCCEHDRSEHHGEAECAEDRQHMKDGGRDPGRAHHDPDPMKQRRGPRQQSGRHDVGSDEQAGSEQLGRGRASEWDQGESVAERPAKLGSRWEAHARSAARNKHPEMARSGSRLARLPGRTSSPTLNEFQIAGSEPGGNSRWASGS